MHSRKILFGFFIAGVAFIGLLYSIRDRHEPPQSEVASLRAEVASLKMAIRGQERASQWPDDSRGATAAARQQIRRPTDEAAPQVPAQPDESAGRPDHAVRMTYEQSQTMVLDAYAEETADSTWSAKATDKLNAVVRGNLPSGSRLSALECRTTMCQVKVIHATPQSHMSFLMDGFKDWPGSVFVAGEQQDRGDLVVTLIAAREGTEPPLGPR